MLTRRQINSPINARRSRFVSRLVLFVILAGLVGAFFGLGLNHDLSVAALQANRAWFQGVADAQPVLAPVAFGLVYVVLAAVSLPVNIPLALVAGAIFGLAKGGAVVSFASATGATLALLASRFLFRAGVRARFGARLGDVEAGIARDGIFYLLTLRLVPAVPYTMVNLVFGLTGLPARRFYWVSQIGMLPATLVYVNAGTRLEQVRGLSDILTPSLVGSLLLLAILPLAARFVVVRCLSRRRKM